MSSMNVDEEKGISDPVETKSDLLFGIEERPTWYLTLFLAFQQFLMSVTSFIPNPMIVASALCIIDDRVATGEFLGTIFFAGGISSLIQTILGVRLPIFQGPSSSFLAPIIMLMKTKADQCPDFNAAGNATALPFEAGSEEHRDLWKGNLREVQGALLVAAVLEVFIGFSGLIGVLMRYIGPLTTGTVITLIGLSLSHAASLNGSQHWWICFLTISLIILFSQYLKDVTIPMFGTRLNIFLLFPILFAVIISWTICAILTVTGTLPDEKGQWGYNARTDIKWDAVERAEWFRFPYPGQWGMPTVSVGGVIAMMAAILASTIESVGDYYACARLCGVPNPPGSAISRGIGIEGICCLIAGALGTGSGLTSYSNNIATIGLTKVASRVVVYIAAVMIIIAGCIGKVGAFFSTVPAPIVGAMIYIMLGLVTGVGISNLAAVNFRSTRNVFVFGFSIFFAVSAPKWVAENPFDLGNDTADQVLTVFCGTSMLVGGISAFVLDNTISGTLQERGIIIENDSKTADMKRDLFVYDLPYIQTCLNIFKCVRWIPFCQGYFKDEQRQKNDDSKTSPDDIELEMAEPKSNGDASNGGFGLDES